MKTNDDMRLYLDILCRQARAAYEKACRSGKSPQYCERADDEWTAIETIRARFV